MHVVSCHRDRDILKPDLQVLEVLLHELESIGRQIGDCSPVIHDDAFHYLIINENIEIPNLGERFTSRKHLLIQIGHGSNCILRDADLHPFKDVDHSCIPHDTIVVFQEILHRLDWDVVLLGQRANQMFC